MINHQKLAAYIIFLCCGVRLLAQEDGQNSLSINGGFQWNGNIFLRDSQIGAFNIPQYDHQIYGGETWLDLNAFYAGFSGGLRFDLFTNSNLLNPQGSYTDKGIGKWYLSKKLDRLELTVGFIYDQIGTGIIYRAYEERAQLIDNALVGAQAKFDISTNWSAKAFVGRQKNLFSTYASNLKGFSLNGFFKPSDTSSWSIVPGLGFVNRTLDEEIVSQLASIIGNYEPIDQFNPFYNSNAFSIFNTLNIKNIGWYVEAAFKPNDLYYDPYAVRALPKGQTTIGKIVKENGSVLYSSLSYAAHGLGITVEGKRTIGFDFRAEPLLSLNKGLINFIPPMAKINTYRLTAYYYPATQFLSEAAYQIDVKYGLSDYWNFSVNYSDIRDKDFKQDLYKEIYSEINYKNGSHYQITGGLQLQNYNIAVYFGKPGEENVKTVTPFTEILYQFDNKTSLRFEGQYMNNSTDIGSWINGLLELGIAPNWLFEVSDMYNIKPVKSETKIHYPAVGLVYSSGSNRLGIRYVKQIEGIVCSGGICRLEPAFSGVKASLTSTF
ncbi:MAG: DUF6029 family protein [Bacteroidota bacterium]|nr:DUF6029 family protein [Bacteroidota bacterium]